MSRPPRLLPLLSALSLGVVGPALFTAPAGAVVTATTVSSSSATGVVRSFGTDILAVETGSGQSTPIIVHGTATNGATDDQVRTGCYHGTTYEGSSGRSYDVRTDHTYSLQALGSPGLVCQLRVIDGSGTAPTGPAAATYGVVPVTTVGAGTLALDPEEAPSRGVNTGKNIFQTGAFPDLAGSAGFGPVAFGGVGGSFIGGSGAHLLDPSFNDSGRTFEAAGALADAFSTPASAAILVDGHGAILPEAGAEVWGDDPDQPAFPGVALTSSYDLATGNGVAVLTEPVLRCASPDVEPPTKASCSSFASAGITLTRTMTFTGQGRQQTVKDSFASTDGAVHSVDLHYSNVVGDSGGSPATDPEWSVNGGAFSQPGDGGALSTGGGGPVTYRAHTVAGTPTFATPAVSITYSSPPIAATFVGPDSDTFVPEFRRSVTADTPATLTSTFSAGITDAENEARAAASRAAVSATVTLNPLPAITSQRTVTLSGTVIGSGNGAPGHVTIGTTTVPVAANGTFSTTVLLPKPGATSFVAMGSDSVGTVSASNTVATTWVLPVQGISVKDAKGKVKVTAKCAQTALTGCTAPITVTIHGKTVASGTLKLKAGQKGSISLTLNKIGRKRLAGVRVGKSLSIKVTVTSVDPSGLRSTVAAKSAKVKHRA